jgi:hypothetical protein
VGEQFFDPLIHALDVKRSTAIDLDRDETRPVAAVEEDFV